MDTQGVSGGIRHSFGECSLVKSHRHNKKYLHPKLKCYADNDQINFKGFELLYTH
jgi:hypothetical protein